jgi:VanZ family protein|tara:strand:+ start:662 stop:1045 length:384 start_codon:yes stop_codon:yes gene_type:complete
MIKILTSIFHVSVIFLIIVSLWPGSLLGYLFYRDWSQEPDLITNPFGTTINHFIYYLYVSLLGFITYLRREIFKKLIFALFFLSVVLELLHLVIPNRSFQLADLIANMLGVIVAYSLIKIYLYFSKL